ncbi:MAG TPA: PQQ-dependent sugar dehydrogenase [Anaerolineae bacterium]|nr:PQQ-dependent sugar dehydrogenase [Anaerolineae bacterium]
MMRLKSLGFYLVVASLLWGCTSGEEVVTPPVVVVATETAQPLSDLLTATVPAEVTAEGAATATTASEPVVPTAVATSTPVPVPTATATPRPVLAVEEIALETVVSGFERPLYLTHAGDERLFVVEQAGVIYIVVAGERVETPFLDIRDRVNDGANEQGLLSLTFHPDYGDNGRFFVNYTRGDGSSVVAEYQVSADPNVADVSSERVLMVVAQPFGNHNGGQLQFGLDGYLYIGLGDGGSAGDPENNGLDLTTLLGSVLRIDIDEGEPYGIPGDNPFVTNENARNEIWAYGLRNPWRFSFDRLTGDLYIADVGQNEWEEINFQAAEAGGGQNYGWRQMEASVCYLANCDRTGSVLPVAEYAHFEGGCSVTGGYVYRGEAEPALWGNYFFGDYCTNIIWSLRETAEGWVRTPVMVTDGFIASFGEDVNGELYVVHHTGYVSRIVTP